MVNDTTHMYGIVHIYDIIYGIVHDSIDIYELMTCQHSIGKIMWH